MKPKSKLSTDICIGVFLGGYSSERMISKKSGMAIYQAISPYFKSVSLIDPKASHFDRKLKEVDLAFLALHGQGGEDGHIQRILERKGVPYTGSSADACIKSFDKRKSKKIFLAEGIETPEYRILQKGKVPRNAPKIEPPYFIKPHSEGSSFGVLKLEKWGQEAVKLKKLLNKYNSLLIEECIEGRELTVGILGRRRLPIIEVKTQRKFYDYKAKYTKGCTQYLFPKDLSRSLENKVKRLAYRAHQALGMRDFSRVDLMLDKKNNPYVLEVNAIPGFTELSLLPKAAKKAGISFEQICLELLEKAWKRRS